MADPFFLFENLYETDIDATSEASGFPKENLTDWRKWTTWKGTSTANQNIDVDYGVTVLPDTLVIAGHNGGTVGGSYRIFYSDNGTAYSAVAAYTPFADDDPVVVTFTESTHRYWRVNLGDGPSAAMYAGIITLGRRLELPRLDPSIAPYSRKVVADRSRNNNGEYLGTNVKYVEKTGLRLNYDTGFNTTTFWDPASGIGFDDEMAPHLKLGKPIWFAWNTDEEARDVWHCAVDEWDASFVKTINRRALKMTLKNAV